MIEKINVTVNSAVIEAALGQLPYFDFRISLNQPTGDFFYDPWVIKDQFKNTVWESLLITLPYAQGEARIVNLYPKECYRSHADIDDRWHLALNNDKSYLIDLESNIMHSCEVGQWYSMNAGVLHTAANFGNKDRIHVLVRKLLTQGHIKDPKYCTVRANLETKTSNRFLFDEIYMPFLNRLNKEGLLCDFTRTKYEVKFKTERNIVIPLHKNFIVEQE